MPVTDVDLEAALDEMAHATDRLLTTLHTLDDADLRAPSGLPGWTRGHVLTHLARNADAMGNLLTWAVTGVETPMYASREARDAAIEAGAGRSAADIEADVESSADRLLAAFSGLSVDRLGGTARLGSGAEIAGWQIPAHRTREVEIHHVDLRAGYPPANWSEAFTAQTLDRLAPFFLAERDVPVGQLAATDTGRSWRVAASGPTLGGRQHDLLAWLTGRPVGAELTLDGVTPADGAVPAAPAWG